MHLDSQTLEEILCGKPDCFAIPHEFHLGTRKCDTCAARSACLQVSAQMFKALKAGMIKGRSMEDLPYERNEGQNIVHGIRHNAPNSSWARPCALDDLTQIFDRAMRAYADRPPQPSHDELLAEIDVEFNELNLQADGDTGAPPTEMIPSDSARGNDTLCEELAGDCCVTLDDKSNGLLDLGDEYDPVDDLLDQISPDALHVIATASASAAATPAPASHTGADSSGTHVTTPAAQPATGTAAPTASAGAASRLTIGSPGAGCAGPSSYSLGGAMRLVHYRAVADETLIKELRIIYDRVTNHGVGYTDVREDYCAINRVQNERQLISPGFRPFLPLPHKSKGKFTPTQERLARDRKMFDIEWLHCFGYPNQLDDPAFAELLCADDLDYDLAATFVTRNWSNVKRFEILALSPIEQHPLGMFVSEEVRKLIGDVRSQARKITLSLKNRLAREPKLLPFIDDYVKLWIASQVRAGERQSAIGQLYGWQKGEKPPAPSTLSSKLKMLGRLLRP